MAADDGNCCYLHRFKLYETRSNFYIIGTDKNKSVWRVLTINRLEPSELHIREDSTWYTADECQDLLMRIHEGNKSTGGLKFVTNCYGIIGFVKFLGPYYMLIITERRKIGTICGHSVFAVSKTEMIVLPSSNPRFNLSNSKNESRYKKLLCIVDLTKDFFFSYSYHVMRSLQKNLCNRQSGQVVYETMFVWNEFLTRGIRNHLKSSIWTVALVYGFFKQSKLSISGKDFNLTLIARRSRYFAGTRYLKRGVNEKGRVANDVETEQIVFENNPAKFSTQITSIVQNRGSIPLFWSQESSRLNLKPDIILQKKDKKYQATKLHFENLAKRYGNPIIILNLIKTHERKPRESILRTEFIKAIDAINKGLTEENRLRFLHWDLNKHSRSKTTNVLDLLGKVANYALSLTGFFHCQVTSGFKNEECPTIKKNDTSVSSSCVESKQYGLDNIDRLTGVKDSSENDDYFSTKPYSVQKGVLRTNCIDCLDRTNVAQYAYGLAALGHQLHVLQLLDLRKIDLDDPLADDLMSLYEEMGDTLALQYGGSAAHNKIFCERRGQWTAATQSQEFFRTLQRYYSNAYMDAEKQDAINVFLGYFQPQQGKPALWELDSDHHFNVGKPWNGMLTGNSRLSFKRSFSEGSILCEDTTTGSDVSQGVRKHSESLHVRKDLAQDSKNLLEFTPDISPYDCDVSCTRYAPGMACRQLFTDCSRISFNEYGTDGSSSNFLDLDWLSSSGNSCDESSLLCSSMEGLCTENVVNDKATEDGDSSLCDTTATPNDNKLTDTNHVEDVQKVSERFKQWVTHGETLCY